MRDRIKNLILLLLACISLLSCSHLFYYPNKIVYATPDHFKIPYEEKFIKTQDGEELHLWHLRPKNKKTTSIALHFHGNAQNLSSHFIASAWLVEHGVEVIIFDYRGYGKSSGQANQKGTYLDSLAFYQYADTYAKKFKKPLFVLAQSLGGAVATRGLVDFKDAEAVKLLIIDSSFTSYQDIAFQKLKSHWLTFLLSPLAFVIISDEMAPQKLLSKIKTPAIIIHSENDPVVPYQGALSYQEKLGGPVELWTLKAELHTHGLSNHPESVREKLLQKLKEMHLII
ncbi:MAG: alpha/beta fold hydrolase [Halobacteriovoraceae bacterium]|nr:alpha/beta fold hydrolase [Halobacteriovoraceae bacterium]